VYKQAQADPPDPWPPIPTATLHNNSSTTPVNILRIAGNRIVLPASLGVGALGVNIIDMQGQCVYKIVAQGNGLEQRLAMPSLKPGFYLLRCSNGASTLERKFMSLR
jgi:hypothetical protein